MIIIIIIIIIIIMIIIVVVIIIMIIIFLGALRISVGGTIRLETLIELFVQFELFELILLLKLDE